MSAPHDAAAQMVLGLQAQLFTARQLLAGYERDVERCIRLNDHMGTAEAFAAYGRWAHLTRSLTDVLRLAMATDA